MGEISIVIYKQLSVQTDSLLKLSAFLPAEFAGFRGNGFDADNINSYL